MITKSLVQELVEKQVFVSEIGKTVSMFQKNVANIKLDVFVDHNGYVEEFLVVTYRGGAVAVRDCAANSHYANFLEIGNLMCGGNYSEVDYYRSLKEKGFIDISALIFSNELEEEDKE